MTIKNNFKGLIKNLRAKWHRLHGQRTLLTGKRGKPAKKKIDLWFSNPNSYLRRQYCSCGSEKAET